MNRYIDAEKLIAKINEHINLMCSERTSYAGGRVDEAKDILNEITSLQQEQPEVDLEKFTDKIKTFQGRYKHPEILSIKGAMAFMARMFYQYPNVARQWYDSLPKATMDDARKEE